MNPPHQGTLQLNGIPAGTQVDRSYRSQTEVFYLLPNGISMSDYNDLDKTYMAPFEKDERFVFGEDGSGNPVYIREVLNPSLQFNERNVRYTHTVRYGQFATYYAENGEILTRRPISDTLGITVPPVSSGGDLHPGSGFTNVGNGIFTATTNLFQATLDTANKTLFIEEFDTSGIWNVRNFIQYDQTDKNNHTPVYRMQAERVTTPSGDCVFKIKQIQNSDFYNANNPKLRESEKVINNLFFNEIELYPNPASQRVWIELPKGYTLDPNESISLRLFSMNGQMLRNAELPAKRISEINTSDLQPGMYILSLRHNNTMWSDKLIIK